MSSNPNSLTFFPAFLNHNTRPRALKSHHQLSQQKNKIPNLTLKMSSWKIFSDSGNNFRWEVTGQIIHTKPEPKQSGALIPPSSSKTHLPSMADLLLQGISIWLYIPVSVILHVFMCGPCFCVCEGCPKLLENGNAPIFRTGSGKSVALKQSSIAKALSVLRDDDDAGASFSIIIYKSQQLCCISKIWEFKFLNDFFPFTYSFSLLNMSALD